MKRRQRNKKKRATRAIGEAREPQGRKVTVKVRHRREKACATRHPKPLTGQQ